MKSKSKVSSPTWAKKKKIDCVVPFSPGMHVKGEGLVVCWLIITGRFGNLEQTKSTWPKFITKKMMRERQTALLYVYLRLASSL